MKNSETTKMCSCNRETIVQTISLSSNSEEIQICTDPSSPDEPTDTRFKDDNNTFNEKNIERFGQWQQ